jgi:hypothetical protein
MPIVVNDNFDVIYAMPPWGRSGRFPPLIEDSPQRLAFVATQPICSMAGFLGPSYLSWKSRPGTKCHRRKC